jgi:hypothetical protein
MDLAVERIASYDSVAFMRLATLDGVDALQCGSLRGYDTVADAGGDDAYPALGEDGEYAGCVSGDINVHNHLLLLSY